MKTILVATDFSPAALNAANYAADMALAINADVSLLHVLQIPVSNNQIFIAVNPEDLQQGAEKNISELKEQLIRKTGGKLNIETEVRRSDFFLELKIVCECVNPYAVVMGSQGTTAPKRLFIGSQAVYAMKHLMWPLITVPPRAKFSAIKKIGLACDFDKEIDITHVDEIKMLAKDFHAELHILHIGKNEVFNPELIFESGLLPQMPEPLKPKYHFITNENTDESIMDFAEKNQIDLLVVLPKRDGLLDKLIHTSHTKQLVLYSHVPVKAIHP